MSTDNNVIKVKHAPHRNFENVYKPNLVDHRVQQYQKSKPSKEQIKQDKKIADSAKKQKDLLFDERHPELAHAKHYNGEFYRVAHGKFEELFEKIDAFYEKNNRTLDI